jgi:Protein of unknown function (DUF3592)
MLAMNSTLLLLALGILVVIAGIAVQIARLNAQSKKSESWPVAEGKIQSVRKVRVSAGRSSYMVEVGDFSYTVNDEYNGGTLKISSSFSTHDAKPKDLIDQTIKVRYNPAKPEKYSIPPQEIGGFLIDPFDEDSWTDIDPIDLDID